MGEGGGYRPRLVFVAAGAVAVAGLVLALVFGIRDGRRDRPAIYPSRDLMVAATGAGDLSRTCAECHAKEFDEWFGSQHAGAQRPVDGRDHAAFSHPVVPPAQALVPSFHAGQPGFRGGGEFLPALAVIGIEPLRQMLLPTGQGRLQVAPLSFDPHRGDWFDAQEPPRHPDDWSFWSNRGMNWNSQCAFCHMTGLEKNYDIATDSYATTWTAMGISCTQCHGDMTAHLADPENPAAFPVMAADRVIGNCASCHARREELTGAFHPGEQFDDHYRLSLPDRPGVFYADGQILDEDFEYASFVLSRMGHAGVSCMDCHNPHSGSLVLPVQNNALCMSCHTPPGTDGAPPIVPAAHAFHAEGTEGSRCVDCHMAETTYMVRDPRRDHGFVVPDPQLTIEAGIPNSCNRCHTDQSAEWARDWTNEWYGAEKMEGRRSRQRARVILRAQEGSASFDPELLSMARGEEIAAWRATLVLLLGPWNRRPDVAEALATWMQDESPLVRSAAVRASAAFENPVAFPPEIVRDPVRLVRLDAAWAAALRGLPVADEEEIRAYLANQSDQPTGALKQAQFALAQGRNSEAVAWARKSTDWDRSSPAAREMLAMVLFATGDTTGARQAFEEAIAIEPGNAGPAFSLALLLAEEGDLTGAIAAFEKAVAADEGFGRAWYNLGLAYSQYGDPRKALAALERAESATPGSADPAYAAATIHLRLRQPADAAAALQRALAADPGHTPSRDLLRRIRPRD
jgi:predicted CXXCH cytochrome family protein